MINQLLLGVSLLVFGFSHPNIPNIPIFVVETEGIEEVVTTLDGEGADFKNTEYGSHYEDYADYIESSIVCLILYKYGLQRVIAVSINICNLRNLILVG